VVKLDRPLFFVLCVNDIEMRLYKRNKEISVQPLVDIYLQWYLSSTNVMINQKTMTD